MMRATATIAESIVVPKNLTIVPMTAEMVPAVSRIHFEAFRGYMNVRLGVSYVRKFITWFVQSSQAITLVALEDDMPVGYVFGAPIGYDKLLNRELFFPAVIAVSARPGLCLSQNFWEIVVAKLAAMTRTTSPSQNNLTLPDPTMSLVAIGVSPLARGKSVGTLLLQHFEAKARVLGIRSLRLSVYSNNGAARSLYEKCGWKCCSNDSQKSAKTLHYFRRFS